MSKTLRIATADALTVSRLGLAVAIIPAAWSMRLTLTSVLVSGAWVSDVLDGRLARSAGADGRMAAWDLVLDTAVGAALVAGLAGAGQIPVPLAAVAIVLFGTWFLRGNIAASMLLQLSGYLPLIWLLWRIKPSAWWLPPLVAALIGAVDWRRLVFVNIPEFIHGITGGRVGQRESQAR